MIGALRLVLFAPRISPWSAATRASVAATSMTFSSTAAEVRGRTGDYERVLKQRNALLRTAFLARKVAGRAGDLSTLDVWDVHLAQHGAELVEGRLELCAALGAHVGKAYDAVSAGRGEARSLRLKSWSEGSPAELDRGAIEARLRSRSPRRERPRWSVE